MFFAVVVDATTKLISESRLCEFLYAFGVVLKSEVIEGHGNEFRK